jgi:FkbM family methyltransferase
MKRNLDLKHASTMKRSKEWGIKCHKFFDVGAAKGDFSRKVNAIWPDTELHLFEAAPHWANALGGLSQELQKKVNVLNAAVGSKVGQMYFRFDKDNPYGGALVENSDGDNVIKVPTITLDHYIERNNLRGPFVLKLDVHGAEKDILSGATNFMKNCELLILETYFFGPAHRRHAQMSLLLEDKFGMQCFDMAEPSWRDLDMSLWQVDLYFAKKKGTTLSIRGLR